MPRPVDQTRTRRVDVQETQNVGRLSVVAPGPGSVVRSAGGTAEALSKALGLATEVFATEKGRADERAAKRGERDFNLGKVDEELRGRVEAYDRAVTRNETEAGWIQDVDEFEQKLREVDLESLDPDQQLDVLNATIDEMYQAKYKGLEDPNAAEVLVPAMEKFRQTKVAELLENQRAIAERKIDADLQTVIRAYADTALEQAHAAAPGTPAHELSASEGFDYLGLHERVRALKPGAETNETYFSILADLAIRNGDPDLIRNIPGRWADGTPSFTSIPAWNQKVRAAESQAENVRLAKANAYDKALKAEQKAALESTYLNTIQTLDTGDYATAQSLAFSAMELPGADASDLLAISKALTSVQNNDENRSGYEPGIAALTGKVYMGQASQGEILTAYSQGLFGEGEQATKRMVGLLEQVEQQGSRRDSDLNRTVGGFKKNISASYKPDTVFGKFDTTLSEIRNAALLELDDRIYNRGEDPSDAFQKVKEKYDPRAERAQALPTTNQAFTPREAASAAIDGTISFFKAREYGLTTDVIEDMVANKQLNPTAAKRLLSQF